MFFSKALFKQSMKANWVKWLSVTVATCVMLAIVIIVLGSLSINDIRDSLKGVFAQADQEAELKEGAIDSYDAYLNSVEFENGIVTLTGSPFWDGAFLSIKDEITTTYDNSKIEYETQQGVAPQGEDLKQLQLTTASTLAGKFFAMAGSMLGDATQDDLAQLMYILILTYENSPSSFDDANSANLVEAINNQYYAYVYDMAYDLALQEEGATTLSATSNAVSAKEVAEKGVGAYVPSAQFDINDYKTTARDEVNELIRNQAYNSFNIVETSTEEQKQEANQYAITAKVISNTSISTYELWLSEGATAEDARLEATKSITGQIDEKVAEALEELGNMDIYGLIIGSIFYRIAGILLPMVYVIMVANGLLAGQVDSGSMAYVLSTPTKRRAVSTTQMLYLLASLLAMFACVTAVSVVSIWIVGGNSFAINFGEILLFNLGAFLTMFAFAGFCFMCSAIFNRTKYSLSIGGGISIFMLVCTILGLFGSNVVPSAMRIDQMNVFNYLSLISLFDTNLILAGSLNFLIGFGVLALVGIVTFVIGTFVFDRKDLPL